MEYSYMGGYRIGWHAEGLTSYKKWFEGGGWGYADCKYFNPYATLVNPEYVSRFNEYKYSGYTYFKGRCIIQYLRLYEKYPQTEYLVKLGLNYLYNSVTVLKRIAKDKSFCKWLIKNREDITENYYYVGTLIDAYKSGKPIKDIQKFNTRKKQFEKESNLRSVRELFSGELEQFFSYIDKQGITAYFYRDYLFACNYLNLDMSLPKNRYPHDFKHWHDIRIDEYHTAKSLADEKERAELYNKFAFVAQKYLTLQKQSKDGYTIVIATSPAELVREGETLGHCVGKMGYDQKFIREETLIFFVRNTADIDSPFVTVEYSLKSKKVLQSYGAGHSKPDDTVAHFINKVWLPFANRTIKKLSKEVKAA